MVACLRLNITYNFIVRKIFYFYTKELEISWALVIYACNLIYLGG
jgi:hypothetical protein